MAYDSLENQYTVLKKHIRANDELNTFWAIHLGNFYLTSQIQYKLRNHFNIMSLQLRFKSESQCWYARKYGHWCHQVRGQLWGAISRSSVFATRKLPRKSTERPRAWSMWPELSMLSAAALNVSCGGSGAHHSPRKVESAHFLRPLLPLVRPFFSATWPLSDTLRLCCAVWTCVLQQSPVYQ